MMVWIKVDGEVRSYEEARLQFFRKWYDIMMRKRAAGQGDVNLEYYTMFLRDVLTYLEKEKRK